MALQRLLAAVGSHHLTFVEDVGIVMVAAVTIFAVCWCMNDQRERAMRKGK